MAKKIKSLSPKDYEFMHALSAAVLQKSPSKLRIVLYFWIVAVFLFMAWANFAMIDEIARGDGEIIPTGQNQLIQNLEGGIVEEMLVREGEIVKKNQILMRINNEKSKSSFSSNAVKANALEAKIIRLTAESTGLKFRVDKKTKAKLHKFIKNERNLYDSNKRQLNSSLSALKERLSQKKSELSEAKSHAKSLNASLAMINKEVRMTKPMVAKGVRSRIDFLKLQREQNEIKDKYHATHDSIPRLKSGIKEVRNQIKEAEYKFQSDAIIKLNEAVGELESLRANSTALIDQVSRTVVRSPMNGIVQNIFANTIGGVIKPGENIMEIVPSDETLLVEVKIKPKDIAFIYFEQKAIVKFTAYDFSIYGGLDGKVVLISPDTIKDEKGNVFYTVRIKTDKNSIGRNGKDLKIIPGMTVSVDIITGQKSVLDYILKPILKTKQYTFTER